MCIMKNKTNIKIGDIIKVADPLNGYSCKIFGTVMSFYEDDRIIIETQGGNTWALKKSQVEVIKNKS